MSDKKPGLGRGLSALLEEIGGPARPAPTANFESADPTWTRIPIGHIVPNASQPRRHFDADALAELADSLRTHGMLQPVIVRPDGRGRYELIAGERRWRAAQSAALHEIPAIVRDVADEKVHEIALIENIQRADLNPIEEAQGYERLIQKFGHTQESIAKATGKSRSHVANMVRLLHLPETVLEHVRQGKLSMGHARTLVGREDASELAAQVLQRGLSVRQTEALVSRPPDGPQPPPIQPRVGKAGVARDPDTEALERALSESVGLKVTIAGEGQAGRVVIDYGTLDQLDMLAQRLSGGRF